MRLFFPDKAGPDSLPRFHGAAFHAGFHGAAAFFALKVAAVSFPEAFFRKPGALQADDP